MDRGAVGNPFPRFLNSFDHACLCLPAQATSLTQELQSVPQQFTGVMQLGIETDTHDTCGRVTAIMPWSCVTGTKL